jgi:hypothetical protein
VPCIAKTIFANEVQNSRFATILLWPLAIAGSVLLKDDNRAIMSRDLRGTMYATWNSTRLAELMERLWADQEEDPRVWGPYGIYLTMEKWNLNVVLS